MISVLAQAPDTIGAVASIGEAITFWIMGSLALAGALGMVFARNAVHSALCLAGTMLSLAVLYMIQNAPFLGFVQIIVYTGAVMMLFLFVLMLVGRDSSDSVIEVLRGQRVAALVLGIGLAVLLIGGVGATMFSATSVGLPVADATTGNVTGIGALIFTKYLFAFELTSALLITAALGAMVLAFAQSRGALSKRGQRATVEARLRGEHDRISPLPGPGVFATGNSVAVPALLPDGSIAPESISSIIDATPVVPFDEQIPDAHALTGRDGDRRGSADREDAGQ